MTGTEWFVFGLGVTLLVAVGIFGWALMTGMKIVAACIGVAIFIAIGVLGWQLTSH